MRDIYGGNFKKKKRKRRKNCFTETFKPITWD